MDSTTIIIALIVIMFSYTEIQSRIFRKRMKESYRKTDELIEDSAKQLSANELLCSEFNDNYITITLKDKINLTQKIHIISDFCKKFNLLTESIKTDDNCLSCTILNKDKKVCFISIYKRFIRVACSDFELLMSMRTFILEYVNTDK